MDATIKFSYYAFAVLLGFMTLYFAFKSNQAAGKSRSNDLDTKYGGGSFRVMIKSSVAMLFWSALCFSAGLGAWLMITKAGELGTPSHSNSIIETSRVPAAPEMQRIESPTGVERSELDTDKAAAESKAASTNYSAASGPAIIVQEPKLENTNSIERTSVNSESIINTAIK